MKTFLYSIPNKIQSFSKKLDVKAALCGKSWEVFNDEGVKQLFIFNEDETILITNNGKVFNASWKFIPQNSSILITTGEETIMFRPAFFNKDVFALQQDGVDRYLFMIDEEKEPLFPNLSLDTLAAYIEKEIATAATDKEEKKKQLQMEKQQERMEQERQRQIKKQQEEEIRAKQLQMEKQKEEVEKKKHLEKLKQEAIQKQHLKEQERVLLIAYISGHKAEIKHSLSLWNRIGLVGLIVCGLFLAFSIIASFAEEQNNADVAVGVCAAVSIFGGIVFYVLRQMGPLDIVNRKLENGIHHHNEEEVRKLYEEL